MKRTTLSISLVVFFASLLVLGVTLIGGRGSSGTIVPGVQAADNGQADKGSDAQGGGCREQCSLHSLRGCYGSTITGTILPGGPVAGPIAGVVLQNFDGQGGLTQVDTVNINGTVIAGRTSAGTYTVNPDCTGTATINFPNQPPLQLSFVLTDNGREIRSVVVNPGAVVTSVGTKQ